MLKCNVCALAILGSHHPEEYAVNNTDVELMRMAYIISSLCTVLFASMLTRWLWRPARFLFLALTISILFTPYYTEQAMPDGSTQNIVPALIVMANDIVQDRDHWQQAIAQRGGQAITYVAVVLSMISLALAAFLPKRTRHSQQTEKAPPRNPYLPPDMAPNSE